MTECCPTCGMPRSWNTSCPDPFHLPVPPAHLQDYPEDYDE